jgi:peptidoglycan/xylan/chitin deacetylase (PgdA/CDA1 family)
MLKSLKAGVLQRARQLGVFSAVEQSSWRNHRLLILCFHGLSFTDEHDWSPGMYISIDTFRERMRLLREHRSNVLPLGEALQRLEGGALPPRSVAITFDDGEYNFYTLAYPILKEFGFPSTVYLPTYYCQNQMSVFDVTASYVMWKGRGQKVDLTGLCPGEGEVEITVGNARELFQKIHRYVHAEHFSARRKDDLAAELARRLKIDYADLVGRRVFHLMTPQEVSEVAKNQVAIELHTHRHRTPRDRDLFLREIRDNREAILSITGIEPRHMCYPCGDYTRDFFPWLREERVRSATTCDVGFAAAGMEPMQLPRLLDTNVMSSVEFGGWLAGFCAALPRRAI